MYGSCPKLNLMMMMTSMTMSMMMITFFLSHSTNVRMLTCVGWLPKADFDDDDDDDDDHDGDDHDDDD